MILIKRKIIIQGAKIGQTDKGTLFCGMFFFFFSSVKKLKKLAVFLDLSFYGFGKEKKIKENYILVINRWSGVTGI